MRRLTRFRSFRAVTFVLLLLSLWGTPHAQQDDRACLPLLDGEHDASKHAIGAASAPVRPEHCEICHWLRGLKPGFDQGPVHYVALHAGVRVVVAELIHVPNRSVGRLPARAPPATL